MNEKLQRSLSTLESLIGTQRLCIPPIKERNYDTYMVGLLNGMLLAQSVFTRDSVNFDTSNTFKKNKRIRHKTSQKRKRV